MTPEQLAEVIELMLGVELLVQPISVIQSESIESWAEALGVNSHSLRTVRATAMGAHRIAQADLYRHG